MGVFALTQIKHITVDGLIPPPPVMVLTALTMVAQFAAPGEWGKRVYVGYMLLNVVVFTSDPMQVLKDTWPTIGDNAMATFVGTRWLEVIAMHCAISRASSRGHGTMAPVLSLRPRQQACVRLQWMARRAARRRLAPSCAS